MKTGTDYQFKLGMFLNELKLPFDESLSVASEIGAEYVWFSNVPDMPEIVDMTDSQIDSIAEKVKGHGLNLFLISAANPFKQLHLTDIDAHSIQDNEEYRKDLAEIARSIEIASRLDVRSVLTYTFAWPGEYSAAKPTWPMRWLTRGGVISDVDMDKLQAAFQPVVEQAEKADVDVVLSMMPWNYTNTTSNFRRIAERIGSSRVKVMWGPADNMNCGENDVATAGFTNVRPYLHSLHVKDLHVKNGIELDFDYKPVGEGDVDFLSVLRNLRDNEIDVVLSLATHFQPANGSRVEAMKTNFENIRDLIKQVESGD